MAGLTRLLIGIIALGSCANGAKAQALYYRTIPIGERAVGLGGSYTGIADDPSATYYNPGGLMEGGNFQLLGSLSSIVFTSQKIERAFNSPDIENDFSSSHTTTLPHFVGTVVKVGKQKFGDKRFAVAFSSFEASRERLSIGFSELQASSSADVQLNDNYRMRWWGLSAAMRIKPDVSIGLSAFLSSQSYGYNEDIGIARGGTLEDGTRLNGEFGTSTTRIGVNAWSFVFRLGALYRINADWQIGFMFQPPGAPIKKDGSLFRRSSLETDLGSAYFLFDEGGFKTWFPIPFEFRVGTEFKPNSLTTVSWDAAVTGPVRGGNLFDPPPEFDPLSGSIAAYFPNSTKRRWTPNASIGAEHVFGPVVVLGGVFTNISAAPNVPENPEEYVPDQISQFGASLAVGVDTHGYRVTLGATGFFGRGDALALSVDRDAQVSGYERTKSNISGVVLYIAGAVSVASKGAKDVQERYQEKKAQKVEEQSTKEDTEADGSTEPDEANGVEGNGRAPGSEQAKPSP